MYLVYSFDSTRNARSLAYALALAPLMFALQGTKRRLFDVKVVNPQNNQTLATFGRKGLAIARHEDALATAA